MKSRIISVFTVLFLIGCGANDQYPWLENTLYKDALSQANGKMLLLDFETEW